MSEHSVSGASDLDQMRRDFRGKEFGRFELTDLRIDTGTNLNIGVYRNMNPFPKGTLYFMPMGAAPPHEADLLWQGELLVKNVKTRVDVYRRKL